MILQVTLTVNEAKRLITRALLVLPEVRQALASGKIFLKGGTTVSLLAEEIAGCKLGICGRVSPRGTTGPPSLLLDAPHSIVIEGGKARNVDDSFAEEVLGLDRGDVLIVSANAIDSEGGAAMMAGSPLGGDPGRVLGALAAEGVTVLIPAGLEKLIPGRIADAVRACGRKRVDLAFGMAVGLIPISGRVITERDAVEILGSVRGTVIGKGGVSGAEGATTMIVEGEKEAIKTIYRHVREIKRCCAASGMEMLPECKPGGDGCEEDLACIYSRPVKYVWGDDPRV